MCTKTKDNKLNITEVGTIKCVHQLLKLIIGTRQNQEEQSCLYFRGEAKDYGSSSFTPSGLRCNDEKEHYYDALTNFPEEFLHLSNISRLSKMQHYGYHTRLLDITSNPLIALWFACDPRRKLVEDGYIYLIKANQQYAEKGLNKLSCDSDKALLLACLAKLNRAEQDDLSIFLDRLKCKNDIIIPDDIGKNAKQWLRYISEVERERPAFVNYRTDKKDLFSVFIISPMIENEHQKRQSGEFLIFGLNNAKIKKWDDYKIEKYIIPKKCKKHILIELEALGVNEATVFGDIDHRSEYLKRKKTKSTRLVCPICGSLPRRRKK